MTPEETKSRESQSYQRLRDEAQRYMQAVYGTNVWFRAPETFENLVERWIWAIASNEVYGGFSDQIMSQIEQLAAEHAVQ